MDTLTTDFGLSRFNIGKRKISIKKFFRVVATTLVAINFLAISLASYSLYDSRKEHIRHTSHNADNFSIILQKNVEGTLNRINLILADISTTTIQNYGKPDGIDNLSEFLTNQRQYLTEIDNIGIIDANKQNIYQFNNSYYGDLLKISDFYNITKNGEKNDLYISAPLNIGPKKSAHIILSRKIEKQGRFYGVAYTVFPVEHLELLFNAVSIGDHGQIILRNQAKHLISRFPSNFGESNTKDTFPSAEFSKAIDQNKNHIIYQAVTPFDNIDRIYSVQKIGRYPLYINIGLSPDDALVIWYEELYKISFILLGFIVLTSAGGLFIFNSWATISKNDDKLQLILNSAGEAIYGIDLDGICTFCNNACVQILGYDDENELLGKNIAEIIQHTSENGRPNIYKNSKIRNAILQGLSTSDDNEVFWRKDRTPFPVDYQAYPQIVNEQVVGAVVTFTDITERKQIDNIIWKQANFDTLTELPNRHQFHNKLEEELAKAQSLHQKFALLFIDLDHFKDVNDSLGHAAGDKLLQEVSLRLSNCVRKTDIVARLGGDEFTIILSNINEQQNIDNIAQKIIKALEEPFIINDNTVNISGSIGITMYPQDGLNVEVLLKNADQAMYFSKEDGRNRYHYFSADMEMKLRLRLEMYHDLREAMTQEQFQFYLQPVVDLSRRAITKAEALIRWNHPTKGFISPADFIPIAEKMGLINELGMWIFKASTTWLAKWLEKTNYQYPLQLSINVSPLQLENDNIVEEWNTHLRSIGLPASFIVIEITEGLLLDDNPSISKKIKDFREMGVQISIDDFGTGYSAMSYLYKHNIDFIKIDKSFVDHIIKEKKNKTIIEALILMAHKLDIKVIAEGIETPQQEMALTESACDYGQGYLFSKPIPAEEFEKLENFSRRLICMK